MFAAKKYHALPIDQQVLIARINGDALLGYRMAFEFTLYLIGYYDDFPDHLQPLAKERILMHAAVSHVRLEQFAA